VSPGMPMTASWDGETLASIRWGCGASRAPGSRARSGALSRVRHMADHGICCGQRLAKPLYVVPKGTQPSKRAVCMQNAGRIETAVRTRKVEGVIGLHRIVPSRSVSLV